MELPHHPETGDAGPDQKPTTTVRWGFVLVVALVGALIALIVILHVIGAVGPAAH